MNDRTRQDRHRRVITVSVITLIINLILGAVKVFFGARGHASALMADGVHSIVDAATTAAILYAIVSADDRAKNKRSDLVSYSVGAAAVFVGMYIIAVKYSDLTGAHFVMKYVPSIVTPLVAAISIAVKGVMAFLTLKLAKEARSVNLKLDGKQHLWDALSSVIALIGIVIAGYYFRIADSIACIVIAVFIIKSGVDIALAAMDSLVNKPENPGLENRIGSLLAMQSEVKKVENVDVDVLGDDYYVMADVYADSSLTLKEASALAARLSDIVEFEFMELKDCTLNILPFEE